MHSGYTLCGMRAALLVILSACSYYFVECNNVFGYTGVISNLDIVTNLSAEVFFTKYFLAYKPVVHKGALAGMDIIHKWSDDYIRRKAEENSHDANIHFDVNKMGVPSGGMRVLQWGEYLEAYNHSSYYASKLVPQWLREDVVLPEPLQCEFSKNLLHGSNIILSSGISRVSPHTDPMNNYVCTLRGTKKFILSNVFEHDMLAEKMFDSADSRLIYQELNSSSVDFEEYPELKGVRRYYHVNTEPGDCIFVPLGWLYEVFSYKENLALTSWILPVYNPNYAPKSMKFAVENNLYTFADFSILNYSTCSWKQKLTLRDVPMTCPFENALINRFEPCLTGYQIKELANGNQLDLTAFVDAFVQSLTLEEVIVDAKVVLEEIFSMLDGDKNGVINKEEFSVLESTNIKQVSSKVRYYNGMIHNAMRRNVGVIGHNMFNDTTVVRLIGGYVDL